MGRSLKVCRILPFGHKMGLGKTLQALSIALYYKKKWPLLIIVPASLRYPWIEEIEKWIPDIHPHDINLIQGGADVEQIPMAQVTVVTYGLLRHPCSKLVQEALYNQQFQVIIVDESHYIKNRKTASTKYIVPLLQRATHKILLTGTPALARPEELYPQLDAILPGKFGSWTNYAKRYCDAQYRYFGQRKQWVTDGASNLEELQRLITQQVMIRRLKKNVLTQLPPKLRQKIPFDLKESNIKKDLDSIWDNLNKALGRSEKTLNSVLRSGAADTEGNTEDGTTPSQTNPGPNQPIDDPLQVAAPATAATPTVFGLLSELYRSTCSAKIGPVKDYLKMLCQNEGLKFIMFAHHHIMMDSLAEQLMDDGIKFIRIDGQTMMPERPKLVHEFQADRRIRCALLSIKAAGVGLTLTAAKLVVFAELDWTPGTLEQCEDRAHRIGQADQVHIHYLVAKNTLDEWVWAALCRKTTVVTTTLNGETQVLDMDHGNKGQIDCLSNAEAFIPQKKDHEDLSTFLQSQPVNQRSIKDFFTPRSRKGKPVDDASAGSSRKGTKRKVESHLSDIDSGGEDEFLSPNTEARHRKKRKEQVDCSSSFLFDDQENSRQLVSDTPAPSTSDEVDLTCDLDEFPMVKVKRRHRHSLRLSRTQELEDSERSERVKSKCFPSSEMSTPVKSGDNDRENRMWNCTACTYLNNDVLPYCEMCSTPKTKKQKSVIASQSNHCRGINDTSNSGASETTITGTSVLGADKNCDIKESLNGNQSEDLFDSSSQASSNVSGVDVVPETDLDSEFGDDDRTAEPELKLEDNFVFTNSTPKVSQRAVLDHILSDSDDTLEVYDIQEMESATPKGTNSRHSNSDTGCTPGTPNCDETEILEAELAAAKKLFSPRFKKASRLSQRPWTCVECNTTNDMSSEDCDGCLASRPNNLSMGNTSTEAEKEPAATNSRNVNLDAVPVYELFRYCCSKNTSRVYVYDQNDQPLGVNFTTLDLELNNFSELPDLLLRPENLKLVQRFVREWSSLAPTKRRLIVKSGAIFTSPSMIYEELKAGRHRTTQRYSTKLDAAAAAISKAEEVGGTVRVIQRPKMPSKKAQSKKGVQFESDDEIEMPSTSEISLEQFDENMKGIVQAVGEDGRPLCVHCQRPYTSQLITSTTVKQNPWQTRFCNKLCMEKHWMKSHRSYTVQQVFQEERGICQICGIDAQQIFDRIKNTPDLTKRAKLIQDSKYKELKTDTKQRMARNPQRGLFWQVDHIVPVVEGGGMCEIDNLRTLCVMCHQKVTSQQHKDRAKRRQMQQAATCGDITAFFQTKS